MKTIRERNLSRDLFIASQQYVKEKEYWLNRLSGELVKTAFPYDHQIDGDHLKLDRDTISIDFSNEAIHRLMELSKGFDYTLHMIFTAAAVVLLSKYTGHMDIILGSPIYKQNKKDAPLINTVLALRNRLTPGMIFKELLLQVRQTLLEADKHQNYSIEALLEHLNIPLKSEGGALFDTAVLLENIHDKDCLRPIPLNMIFSFLRLENKVKGRLTYNPCLYKKSTAKRITGHFIGLLEKFLDNIHLRLSDVDLLSGEEKKRLLYDFNDTAVPYARHKLLHEIFEEQVEKKSHRTAVVGVNGSQSDNNNAHLTYFELNKKSNRLAHLLREKGVKPGTLVGIMMERGIDMTVSITAVLKSGGAYLPIETDAPEQRLAETLEDSQAPILLTGNTTLKKYSYTLLQGLRALSVRPFVTPERTPMAALEQLPFPDRSLVDYEKFNRYIGHTLVQDCISIQATRGCPFSCAYCHKIWPKTHAVRPAESIFAEVQLNYNLGVRRFSFVDDIFNFNVKNSRRFFQLIIENHLDIQLLFMMRGDILTPDYIDLMVKAGVIRIALALETASPRLQKLIRKNLDLEKFRKNIEYIAKTYPHIILELYTMHGFPTETKEEAQKTLDFIKSIQWLDFPYIFVLTIHPNTEMETLAIEKGISMKAIERSMNRAYHELPETLPFEKSFTSQYQADFLYNYFLSKERLLNKLPFQMKVLTEGELVQKYNSYLPVDISSLEELLEFVDIRRDELNTRACLDKARVFVPGLNEKNREAFCSSSLPPEPNAYKILLLDLSQDFSHESNQLNDLVEPPLGLMYLLTWLKRQWGNKINGKIAKSLIDFDCFEELNQLLEEFKPDLIGIRTLSYFMDFFHRTAAKIRQWGVRVPIIAGGPYATSGYRTLLKDKNIDLVVLGEGEITFSEVIQKIMENNGQLPGQEVLQEIPGLAFIPKTTPRHKFAREIIIADDFNEVLAGKSMENPVHVNQPGDPAYVIYTSGSTGKPKGVMLEHENVNNLLLGLTDRIYHQYSKMLNVALLAPYVFDASVKQIFGCLLLGNTLYIVPETIRVDGRALIDFYNKHQIDVSDGTPTHLKLLTEILEKTSSFSPGHFIIGGEVLSKRMVENFFTLLDGPVPVITNVYGPTECCVDSASFEVSERSIKTYDRIPIGRPMCNHQIYIINKANKLQPVGIPGELYIGGHGVARGYLNNSELTFERFPPVSAIFNRSYRSHMSYISHKSYLYKTGDLARWLLDGNIEFLGRIDHQVKIRGCRIELEEIENRLVCHPDVKEAVVIVKENKNENNRDRGYSEGYLCAYVVPTNNTDIKQNMDGLNLRDYISAELPAYMVPSCFIPIDNVPFTSNGKVDRKALEMIEWESTHIYTEPRDDIEKKLAKIWSRVLGIDNPISINDNFFQLGGHSLKATILAARIHKAFDLPVPLHQIFAGPTIKRMAQCIKEKLQSPANPDKHIPIRKVEEKEYYELSSAQRRLYFLQQLDLQSTGYNLLIVNKFEGEIHRDKLCGAFLKLMMRHESLRTAFEVVDNKPRQRIYSPGEVRFQPAYQEIHEEEVDQFRNGFITAFDLSRAPLFKVALLKVGKELFILMVNMHHIICDGTSQTILVKEFIALYGGETPAPLRIQYKDFSEWQNSEMEKQLIKKQEHYWLKRFAGDIPALDLPTDFERPFMKSFEGERLVSRISISETRQLKDMAAREDVTLYTLLLAIYTVFLHKLTGQEDIVVGTPQAGRRHVDLQPLIGMLVNNLAMRNFPQKEKPFKQFLKEVTENTLQAFQNQDYIFEELVKNVVKKVDHSRNPIFDTVFVLQNLDFPKTGIPGLKLLPYSFMDRVSKFDLGFFAVEGKSQLKLLVEYSTKLFRHETIKRFIRNFNEVLASILANKNIPLQDIPITHGLEPVQSAVTDVDFDF